MSNSHVSLDEYYLRILKIVATRGTCRRRKVAAIITDTKGVQLGAGYNGPPRGMTHCIDTPCEGAGDEPGDSSRCMAVHSEINAMLQCTFLERAFNMYVTCVPCFSCAKAIANTSIRRVVCLEDYADQRGKNVFKQKGIELYIAHING